MQLREAMTRVYQATNPYWSGARVHVDEGYRNLPGADTLTDLRKVCRDDRSHYTDVEATFGDWVGYLMTWSGLQNMIKERGAQEVESLMETFREECAGLLGVGRAEVEGVPIVLRTKYWMTLYQK